MQFVGRVWKEGRDWLVEVPALDLMTQGTSRKNALEMIQDALETLLARPGFVAKVIEETEETFFLEGSELPPLLSLLLKRQREKAGLSQRQAAERLGSSSHNSWAAYEQGEREPSLSKVEELLAALGPNAVHLRVG